LYAGNWLFEGEQKTETLSALNRLDIAGLNGIMAIATRFIKCLGENFLSYFDIFPMLQKSMGNVGSQHASENAETLMQAGSERSSRTKDFNIIVACCLVTPVGKIDSGAVQRPSMFAASMEVMRKQGVDALAKALSHDIGQIISLFQDYFANPCQPCSVKDLYSNP
jgi:hypothetical protein